MSIVTEAAMKALGAPARLAAIQSRVFRLLDDGALTGEAALLAWAEVKMLLEMQQRLTKLEQQENENG